jgi:hypothetical protein
MKNAKEKLNGVLNYRVKPGGKGGSNSRWH